MDGSESLSRTNMPCCCTCRPVRQKQWQVPRLRCSVIRAPWAARTCIWRTSLSLTVDKSSSRCVVPVIHTCISLACTFWHAKLPAILDMGLSCVHEIGNMPACGSQEATWKSFNSKKCRTDTIQKNGTKTQFNTQKNGAKKLVQRNYKRMVQKSTN